jgi:hypothetical protein
VVIGGRYVDKLLGLHRCFRAIETTLKFVNGKKTKLATELHPGVKEDIRGMLDMTEAERAYR